MHLNIRLPTFLLLLTLSTPGCASATRAQLALTAQARKGVAQWAAREAARAGEVDWLYAGRRKALDDGFDADVRRRAGDPANGPIDAAWVIEARKAYAIGVGAVARAEAAARAAAEAARANAAATDAALARLEALQTQRLGAESLIPSLLFPNVDLSATQGVGHE